MEIIYTWIRNIVIYMILNSIIMNLLGNSSHKKYISIASGFILVMIVISPLIQLLKLDDNLDYYIDFNNYTVDASEFQNEANKMEEQHSDLIFNEYETKIKTHVKNMLLEDEVYLESLDITIDQDSESPTFGMILSMNIKANLVSNEEDKDESIIPIEDIEIEDIAVDKQEEPLKGMPSPMEATIINKLSDFYNIMQENINISIQGG